MSKDKACLSIVNANWLDICWEYLYINFHKKSKFNVKWMIIKYSTRLIPSRILQFKRNVLGSERFEKIEVEVNQKVSFSFRTFRWHLDMSNYDYNKGYRWFRFQKDSAIDSSLPPLASYRSMRELNPILWMSNAEHVANNERGHVHSDSGSLLSKTHETSSLHLPVILAGSISNASYAAPSVNAHEADMADYNIGYGNTDTLAFPLYISTPASQQQSVVRRTPVHKTRTKRTHTRKSTRERPNHGTQTSLEDCLFIQNGIQRFPASIKGFLSVEKEMDIKEWINGSKPGKWSKTH